MIKILFLSANPLDITRLSLDEERRSIDTALLQSEFREQFALHSDWATRVSDLQELLLRHRPDIVHYSGHGSNTGEIILENDQGNAVPVSIDALSNLFRLLKDNIRCVVLNACYSDDQATSIAQHIDCVIGMSDAISDQASLHFSTAFYRALGYGYSIQAAFDLGRSSVELNNLKDQDKPKLIANRTDPAQLVFAEKVTLLPFGASDTIQAELGNEVRNEQERLTQLNKLKSLSKARCIARWQAVGLSHSEAIKFADDPTIGSPQSEYEANPEKPLIILIAELGAGKSLIIERLFQKAIELSIASTDVPIPVYLEAAECVGGLIEQIEKIASKAQILGNTDKEGIAVFVDGVDRVDRQVVQDILEDSRIIVNSGQKSTVTLASRPIYVFNDLEEAIKVPPMSEEETQKFISRIANRENFWLGSWSKSIQDAVRRPLFAILLGIYLRQEEQRTLYSRGELISELVKRSFRQAGVNIVNAYRLLENLAILCIERSGTTILKNEVGSYDEIQMLVESRLIVENSGTIAFALPIFTEWFAAHSLSKGHPLPERLLIDEKTIEKWRYPLIIYVAIFNHEQVSVILTPLCEQFPAFASQILAEGINRWGEPEYDTTLSELEYGNRIRSTMQAWAKGIGPLAKLIAPINEDNSLRPLGIAQYDQIITFTWYHGQENLLEISSLSDKTILYSPEWPIVRSGYLGRQSAWIWEETHKSLAQTLSRLLKKRQLPVTDGTLLAEVIWETALTVAGHNSLWPRPIPIQELGSGLQNLSEGTIYSIGRKTIPSLDIKRLKAKLDILRDNNEPELRPPWPTADLVKGKGWIWESYSNERLLERTRAIYQAAIQCYTHLVRIWFSTFASRFQTAATLPARLVGVLEIPQTEGKVPIMQWHWDPLPSKDESIVDIQLGSILWRSDTKIFHNKARENLRLLRPNLHQWMYTSLHDSSLNDVLQLKPVTQIVYNWLWDDLKEISWVYGML